ncbi:MAG: type II secretion system protein [Alphaproteobacteria bacterium]
MRRMPHRQRGFNLIELAIVLGVAGMLAGAIWLGARAVAHHHNINRAVDQLQQIVENVRDAYTNAAILPDEDYILFTQRVARKDVFPAETKLTPDADPKTCGLGAPCYFAHPWSSDGAGSICGDGTICVSASPVANAFGNVNPRYGITIMLRNLPQAACIDLGTKLLGVMDQVGLVGIGVDTGDAAIPGAIATPMPPTPTWLAASCTSANANRLYFAFRLNPS